ncbi:hypothetical protein [Leuconostoc lactis]|uniref:hypothetical protein n=1 Tax=Leuconostoc lactis TaxID=1246 RepID=UPI000814E9B6|nr:hypothetical protein [Leuconostoc lactis]ANY12314.1 hypothetical protein BCR17_07970 [Leuconostoc lactis]
MFGFKKKKQTVSHQYFARIEQGSLDFEQGNLQEIADNTGSFSDDWPNVSLQDLQDFLSRATNDVVRAGGHDLHLQRISYMHLNEKGQSEPTGLSWETVVIDAGFENFVVSTADQILNDVEVRQDEEMTFDIIMTALTNLQDAALSYTDLTLEDMPALPTEEAYREAQETGERLAVQPMRFNQFTVVTPNESVISDTEESTTTDQESEIDNTFEPKATVSEPEANVNGSDLSDAPQFAHRDSHIKDQSEVNDQARTPTQKMVDNIDLQTPLFIITGETRSLPADNENYVVASLNLEKQKANDFLTETSNVLTREVQSKLANILKERQSVFLEKLDVIQNTDVQSAVTNQLDSERQDEYQERFNQRKTAREAGFQADIAAENDRHQQTLASLKNTYVEDLENLKTSVTQELDNWYLQRSQALTDDLTQQLNDRVASAQKEFETVTLAELTEVSNKLVADNTKSLRGMHEKLTNDLDDKRQKFEKEHLATLEQMTRWTSIQNEAKNIDVLEKQIQTLKKANLDLEQRLKAKETEQIENAALIEIRHQLAQLQTQPTTKSDQLNDQLVSLLTQQMASQNSSKSSSVWKKIAIGSLLVLALGGVGAGSYALAVQQHAQTTKNAQFNSTSTAPVKSAAILPQASSTQTSSVKQDNSSSDSSSSTNQDNTLNSRFHTGDQVNVVINGKNVTAPVTGVSEKSITVKYDGYDYDVPLS